MGTLALLSWVGVPAALWTLGEVRPRPEPPSPTRRPRSWTLYSLKKWTGTSSSRQASRMKRSTASLGLRPPCSRCRVGACLRM